MCFISTPNSTRLAPVVNSLLRLNLKTNTELERILLLSFYCLLGNFKNSCVFWKIYYHTSFLDPRQNGPSIAPTWQVRTPAMLYFYQMYEIQIGGWGGLQRHKFHTKLYVNFSFGSNVERGYTCMHTCIYVHKAWRFPQVYPFIPEGRKMG